MTWMNVEIDHVTSISSFGVSNDEELKEALNLKNTQLLQKQVHLHRGHKFDFLAYRLHFFEAYQFINLNEEQPN